MGPAGVGRRENSEITPVWVADHRVGGCGVSSRARRDGRRRVAAGATGEIVQARARAGVGALDRGLGALDLVTGVQHGAEREVEGEGQRGRKRIG